MGYFVESMGDGVLEEMTCALSYINEAVLLKLNELRVVKSPKPERASSPCLAVRI